MKCPGPPCWCRIPSFQGKSSDFPLKAEVRGTGTMTMICFVGNVPGTVPLVSSQCFPLAGIAAAAEVLQ